MHWLRTLEDIARKREGGGGFKYFRRGARVKSASHRLRFTDDSCSVSHWSLAVRGSAGGTRLQLLHLRRIRGGDLHQMPACIACRHVPSQMPLPRRRAGVCRPAPPCGRPRLRGEREREREIEPHNLTAGSCSVAPVTASRNVEGGRPEAQRGRFFRGVIQLEMTNRHAKLHQKQSSFLRTVASFTKNKPPKAIITSKCMHGMNQTEAEYSRHGKRSQRASLSQIGPVVLEVGITRYLLRMHTIGHVTEVRKL